MYPASGLYREIIASPNYRYENRVTIDTVGVLGESQIYSLETNYPLDQTNLTIGTARAGEIDLVIIKPLVELPGLTRILVEFRASTSNKVSEWIPKGTYFIDTAQEVTKTRINIHGYDAMLFCEQDYPDTNHDWPYPDIRVIEEIAQTIGTTVDSRVYKYITAAKPIEAPTDYTMREILERIAGMYCGNFVMSYEGKLLFVPLFGFDPPITGNYLADEYGNAIVFGSEGWYTLV